MSRVLSEFKWAVRTAVSEPLYVLLVVVASAVVGVASLILGFIPLVGPLVNGVVLTPVLLVATLGSAYAVRHGDSAVDGAVDVLERAGLAVVGAYAILAAVYVVVLVVFGSALFLAGASSAAVTNGASALSSLGGVLFVVLGLVFLCLAIAAAMTVQFVAPSAVVAGTGAVDSLRTAYRFFRRNLLGVTGFSLVLAGVGVAGLLITGLLYAGGRTLDPLAGVALAGLGYLATLTVLGILTPLYQVAYFEETVDEEMLPSGHEWPGVTGGEEETDDDTAGDESVPAEPAVGGFAIEMTGDDPNENGESDGNSTQEDR